MITAYFQLLTQQLRGITNWPMVQDFFWKVLSYSAFQRISCFLYGTRRLITKFKGACHWSLSWARYIQSTSSHMNIYSNIIFPSTPRSSEWFTFLTLASARYSLSGNYNCASALSEWFNARLTVCISLLFYGQLVMWHKSLHVLEYMPQLQPLQRLG